MEREARVVVSGYSDRVSHRGSGIRAVLNRLYTPEAKIQLNSGINWQRSSRISVNIHILVCEVTSLLTPR